MNIKRSILRHDEVADISGAVVQVIEKYYPGRCKKIIAINTPRQARSQKGAV
jgi:hypothetical protein